MGEYVYRAQDEYKNGEPIKCKKPESKVTLQGHIGIASKKKSNGSKFISTTGRIGVAKYKYSGEKRSPIILIDLGKLKEKKPESVGEIFDFRVRETRDKLLRNEPKNFACADREITVENCSPDGKCIPAEYCRKIPPLLIDILACLDKLVTDSNASIRSIQANNLINYINDEIMGKKHDDTIISRIVNGAAKLDDQFIKDLMFNELERVFLLEYYSDDMPKMEDVAEHFFGNKEDRALICCQCIKAEVLKRIFNFMIFFIRHGDKKNLDFIEDGITKDEWKNKGLYKDIEASDLIGSEVYAVDKSKKIKTTVKKENNSLFFISDCLSIPIASEMNLNYNKMVFSIGYMTYEEDGTTTVHYNQIRRENGAPTISSECSILLDENQIKHILSHKKNSGTLNVTEIGEKSLIGLEPDSIATVNRRENAQINHEVSIDAQGVEQGEKTENKPEEGSEDGPGL